MANFPGTAGDDLFFGTAGSDTMTGVGGNDKLYGLENDDSLDGGDGNDILDGGTGADSMTGGIGNDVFVVDNSGDLVIEAAGGGADLVFTFITYTLPSEVERLAVYDRSSTLAINLTGNALDNELVGNDGANILDGGAGRDIMQGAGGDDQYIVSLQGNVTISINPSGSNNLGGLNYAYLNSDQPDIVAENQNGGTDTIWVPFTGSVTAHNYFDYTLIRGDTFQATRWVERLGVFDPTTTYVVNLQGDNLNNEVIGNNGQNILDGWTGADTLRGLGGDDTYLVDNAGDVVIEAAGGGYDTIYIQRSNERFPPGNPTPTSFTLPDNVERLVADSSSANSANTINLTGNTLDNEIKGNGLNNTLDGKEGVDILIGSNGADTFNFTTALTGPSNVDQLPDFTVGADKIALDDAIFTGLTPGALPAGAFALGDSAQDADDRIVYNYVTGALYFDPDGTGAAPQVQFATLHENLLTLSASDFVVI
jgi:Ca2+-binding RTX toxin-like protein